MATNLTVNGTTYAFPTAGQSPGWGAVVTNWATAVTNGMLQKSGGSFTLTADVDFGATYGLKSAYYSTRNASPASAGQFRLGNAETIQWRDNADSADLALTVNSSDLLEFNGNPLVTLALGSSEDVLAMNAGGTAYEWDKLVNANIDAAAAIAYSKLNLSDSIVNADINSAAAIAYSKLNLTGAILNADINASAAIAYSKLSLTGSIVNADVNASAAIAYSKLTLTDSIVNADVNSAAAIAYSKLNLSGSIVNADVSASAAIAYSKLNLTGAVVFADLASAAVADEDDMVSNSATKLATQQSIKAYVDNEIAAITVTGANTSAKVADYTVTDSDNIRTVLMTTSTTDRTVTLPTAADNAHRIITIKKVDSGSGKVTIDGEGAETIDGSASIDIFGQYGFLTVQCDGTEWHVLDLYDQGTWTPAWVSDSADITGTNSSWGTQYWTRNGRFVQATISAITGYSNTSGTTASNMVFTSTGLPGVSNSTVFSGVVGMTDNSNSAVGHGTIVSNSGADTNVFMYLNTNGLVGAMTINTVLVNYIL